MNIVLKLPWNYVYNTASERKYTELTGSPDVTSTDIINQDWEKNESNIVEIVDKDYSSNKDNIPKRRGRRPNVPKLAKQREKPDIEITASTISQMQVKDRDLGEIVKLKIEGKNKPTFKKFVNKSSCLKYWLLKWELLQVKDNMLCYYWEDSRTSKRWRICTPKALQKFVLWYIHDSPTGGHQGISRTCKRARRSPFYWPRMNQSVKEYVQTCDICEEKKQPQSRKRHTMKSYIMGARFERVASDIAGPFPQTDRGNSYIVVVEDYFTKFIEVYPIENIEAETVANVLLKGWIKRYGCPIEIHTDQGTQYESQLFQGVCKLLNISKTRTTPAHTRSDGMVERSNRTIKEMLAKYVQKDQRDWYLYIDYIVMAYNATPHQSTGLTPHKMVFGDEMRMPLDILSPLKNDEEDFVGSNEHYFVAKLREELEKIHEIARDTLNQSAVRQKEYYDRGIKEIKYAPGNLVRRWQPQIASRAKKKMARNWTGPWIIIEKLTDVLFKIKHSHNSPPVIIHADNLKPYKGEKTMPWFKPNKTILDATIPDLSLFESRKNDKAEFYPEETLSGSASFDKVQENNRDANSDTMGTPAFELPPDGVQTPPSDQTESRNPSIKTRVGRTIRPPLRYRSVQS